MPPLNVTFPKTVIRIRYRVSQRKNVSRTAKVLVLYAQIITLVFS